MNLINITATDLPDAWFQCIYNLLDCGREFKIDSGSFAGQTRLEFDYITIQIKHPESRPLLPKIPAHLGIPDPVESEYIHQYLPYLMTNKKNEGEDYTYGERLAGYIYDLYSNVDQMAEVINMYKEKGFRTNQACMAVGVPQDIRLNDPPCLRSIDTRIQDNKLHFFVYFRSWDLWGGFPANLAAIQIMKEFMADEIGVETGETIASSKGLHLYDYAVPLAKLRCLKK